MARARLQQERSRATRRGIIDATEALWRERDYDEVSVEEICQAAGVAKGTFYFYFPRKEHLLVMLVFGRFMPRAPEVEGLLASNLSTAATLAQLVSGIASRVRKLPKPLVLRAVEESFRHYREVSRLEGGDRFLRNTFHPILARGVERGELRQGWDVAILAGTMGWGVLQEIFMWARGETLDRNLDMNLRQRAELLVHGAATPRRDSLPKTRVTRATA